MLKPSWHEPAEDRTAWRKAVKKGVRLLEDDRVRARDDKRLKRKANEALDTNVQQIPSADFVWQTCGRACKIKVRLLQSLQNPSTAALTSSKSMSPPPLNAVQNEG